MTNVEFTVLTITDYLLQHAEYSYQNPIGSLLYFGQDHGFKYGHIAISLGTSRYTTGPLQRYTIYYTAEIGGLRPATTYNPETQSLESISKIYTRRNNPYEHAYIQATLLSPKGDAHYGDHLPVTFFTYKGPDSAKIRIAAAVYAYLFITNKQIVFTKSFGSVCKLLLTRCKTFTNASKVIRSYMKYFATTKGQTVCSGFAILMFQFAFVTCGHAELVDKLLPFDALACRPQHMIHQLEAMPTYWEKKVRYDFFRISFYPRDRNYESYANSGEETGSVLFQTEILPSSNT
jgi:hypothetical protein